jgi:hypothetical protein
VSQIIVAAMTVGCILLLAVGLIVVKNTADKPLESLVVTCFALGFAIMMLGVRTVVPGIFVARSRQKIRDGTWTGPRVNPLSADGDLPPDSDTIKLAQVFITRTILSAAILEGAVFLLLVAYLVERSPFSLAFAIILLLALAAHFPTKSYCAGWVAEQARLLEEERML